MVRMRGIIGSPLSTPFHKYDHVCCVAFRFWLGATREHPPSRPVGMTEEQQRQNRKATQPCGRRFFSAPTSLLAPYRPLKGMRVARASSGPKIPRRKRGRIYEMGYLGTRLRRVRHLPQHPGGLFVERVLARIFKNSGSVLAQK